MTTVKQDLIRKMIDCRLQGIFNDGQVGNWIVEVLNSGWIGYEEYTNTELCDEAEEFGIENVPFEEDMQCEPDQ
jgi:hypothetical protein